MKVQPQTAPAASHFSRPPASGTRCPVDPAVWRAVLRRGDRHGPQHVSETLARLGFLPAPNQSAAWRP